MGRGLVDYARRRMGPQRQFDVLVSSKAAVLIAKTSNCRWGPIRRRA